MAFKYLNRCSVKLRNPDLIKEAFFSYCEHLKSGYPKEAWVFKKEGKPLCSYQTIEKYIEEMPDDFKTIHMVEAEAERYKLWFTNVSESALGTNKDANTASLQMIMRNMFGWDKRSSVDENQSPNCDEIKDLKPSSDLVNDT